MIYPITLSTSFALVGTLLVALGALALARRDAVQKWLRALPRSRFWGYVLLAIVTVWSFWLIATIDLGEFDNWRSRVLIFIPIAAILTGRFVDELLSARALGMLFLLAAEPLLESSDWRPESSRLFLAVLVYVAIIVGMFWIGMPYLMRDAIAWLTTNERRWKTGALVSITYGAVLLGCIFTLKTDL